VLHGPLPQPFYEHSRLEEGGRERSHTCGLRDQPAVGRIIAPVQISPDHMVTRRAVTWDGMAGEVVQAARCERIEYRYRGQCHLLALYEQGGRRDGVTSVEGLPRSTLRDFKQKLTFVPADHDYREWHEPRALTRLVYFYIAPDTVPSYPESGFLDRPLSPRLYFEDSSVLHTALKLKALMETDELDNRLYFDALGVVLAHELARLSAGTQRIEAPVRGGLAAWQQRTITEYIEQHLSKQVSLATLAQLVRLSPYYFCRAFKQSFGLPPHRYHNIRRIELAKTLLAKPAPSVTEIGLTVGFSESSSFTAAFRKATGLTPTAYRRNHA
jgi:AraC family transcriptional regulator